MNSDEMGSILNYIWSAAIFSEVAFPLPLHYKKGFVKIIQDLT